MDDLSKYYPERFLNQAETIMDFGARLDRVAARHIRGGTGPCLWCELPWPCPDRQDAEWRP